MRVIHIIDNLSPGGTEMQCLALVRGLSQNGVENAVFCFRSGPLLEELKRLGTIVRALPCGSFRSWHFPFRLTGLARAMRQWRADVVQTYGFYSSTPGLPAAFLARVPVRIAGRRDLGDQISPAQRRVDRWSWRFAHRVVANSEAVRRNLIATQYVPPEKVVVIRNGLDLQNWPVWNGAEIDTGDVVVGMLAHFREQKDHATFLRAAKEILAVIPTVRFHLLGSGALEGDTHNFADQLGISSHVEFLGALQGDALRAAVRRFRVSVLTSKNNEGLPNAVLESMAASVPMVATAVGGVEEILEDGVTGFVVPPETPTAVAKQVIRLLKEPLLARRIGQAGRRKVEKEFTIERMVDQFHDLYRDCLRARRGYR